MTETVEVRKIVASDPDTGETVEAYGKLAEVYAIGEGR